MSRVVTQEEPALRPTADPSLFGFAIREAVGLRFLRAGGGVEPLAVVASTAPRARPAVAPIGEWPLHGTPDPESASLYEVPGGYEYWTTDAGRFLIDLQQGRIEVPADGDEMLREQRLHGMPMLLSFAHRGDFSLHAAAVQIGAGAVILAAPSRFGKTTLACAFHQRGHRLLSEDLVCCRPGTMEVLPGPAVVRLRPDVYSGEPPAGMNVVAERTDRIFLALDADRRGSSAPVPITGIVFLREGDTVRLEPASTVDAVKDLWHLGFHMPTSEGRALAFRQLTALVSAIPLWNVYRPLHLDLLEETVTLIERSTSR